jgi:hypothetical protein
VVSVSAKGAKKGIIKLMNLIKNDERYFFPKAMDVFYELPAGHQKSMLSFFADKEDESKWRDHLNDDTEYPRIIRSILFYYSGREDLGAPSKAEFRKNLLEYTKSPFFEEAESGDFMDAMAEL